MGLEAVLSDLTPELGLVPVFAIRGALSSFYWDGTLESINETLWDDDSEYEDKDMTEESILDISNSYRVNSVI